MNDDSDFPSPQEMTGWLQREIANSKRAAELRIKDATAFVNDYAAGKITSDEAAERSFQHSKRWGDALPGILSSEGMTDEEITKHIDEIRNRQAKLGRGGSFNSL
jgi:hypothetical protein